MKAWTALFSLPLFLFALFTLFVAGCATTESLSQQAAKADFGPAPANPRQLVGTYFAKDAYQPGSLQISAVGQPYKAYVYDPAYVPKGQNFGWGVTATVSGKDHGGYPLGPTNYVLFVRNGVVLNSYEVLAPQTAANWVRPISDL